MIAVPGGDLAYGTRDGARWEGEGLEGSLEKPSGKENEWRNENAEGWLALHRVLQPLLLPGCEGLRRECFWRGGWA